ncbi:type VI secretion system protein VasI [Cricetibacter osteomyelitidis]|uniref:Type VI secretion system protein VasI n=1 Tax=Cricetibacter osteomyelitidis TaxID=1521931 RepID=A0A4R2T2H0_9PAST|nr:type VI secretion system-associated protein TagO [Cricetibacter osteomyelitidis]TCP91178.1 type VI secretion system protein VasI [Cricetibacter osteomyelitidis]
MVNHIFKLKKILLLSCLVFTHPLVWADNQESGKGEQCRTIKSNVKRLACFDNAFDTPVRSQLIDKNSINSVIPNTVSDIFALAQSQTESAVESEEELQIALSSENHNAGAAIYIACRDNITRFQIALKDPVKRNPLQVEIQDETNGKSISNISWQNTERGYLLDAGRGLYAIQQLKSMLYIERFNIVIPQENRKFTFKNNGLASRIASIRKECGW